MDSCWVLKGSVVPLPFPSFPFSFLFLHSFLPSPSIPSPFIFLSLDPFYTSLSFTLSHLPSASPLILSPSFPFSFPLLLSHHPPPPNLCQLCLFHFHKNLNSPKLRQDWARDFRPDCKTSFSSQPLPRPKFC